jgi:hypothetical protein
VANPCEVEVTEIGVALLGINLGRGRVANPERGVGIVDVAEGIPARRTAVADGHLPEGRHAADEQDIPRLVAGLVGRVLPEEPTFAHCFAEHISILIDIGSVFLQDAEHLPPPLFARVSVVELARVRPGVVRIGREVEHGHS